MRTAPPPDQGPNANRNAAVAISYDDKDAAPRVVAKGYGQLADTIVRAAEENGLYVHESRELVGLLMQVDLDAHIPPQLYVAVAELLAWLYRLESRELPDAAPPALPLFSKDTTVLDASDPEFLLTRPEDMRAALFELTHPDSHILVRDAADREMAVLVLGADKQTRQFFWRPRDYAGADFEQSDSMGLLSGTTFHFHATAYGGVQIRFRVERPEVIHFDDGSAALMSPFPEHLARIQRRKMFRASLITNANRCQASWQPDPTEKPISFSVRDLSVDGVGLRVEMAVQALPERGSVLEDVRLDFGDLGKLSAHLQVRNVYPISGQPMVQADSPDEPAPTHVSLTGEPPMSHLGAVFLNLDARQENWLQQVVWRLEKNAR